MLQTEETPLLGGTNDADAEIGVDQASDDQTMTARSEPRIGQCLTEQVRAWPNNLPPLKVADRLTKNGIRGSRAWPKCAILPPDLARICPHVRSPRVEESRPNMRRLPERSQ